MFKNFLFFLDKPVNDGLSDRIDSEPIVAKYWFNLGATIVCLIIACLFGTFSILTYDNKEAPITFSVNKKTNVKEELILLPYPHQSFKNISEWIVDAVTASYSFDFRNYDKQVEKAGYYFTPDGYRTYLNALIITKVKQSVIDKKLEISIIPLQNPVLINGGSFGSTEFWRFQLPVRVSYYGGKEPVIQSLNVEVLVLRVPTYQNYKGLSIAEFNMVPI